MGSIFRKGALFLKWWGVANTIYDNDAFLSLFKTLLTENKIPPVCAGGIASNDQYTNLNHLTCQLDSVSPSLPRNHPYTNPA